MTVVRTPQALQLKLAEEDNEHRNGFAHQCDYVTEDFLWGRSLITISMENRLFSKNNRIIPNLNEYATIARGEIFFVCSPGQLHYIGLK